MSQSRNLAWPVELDTVIHYEYVPEERPTMYARNGDPGDPGSPAEITITAVMLGSLDIHGLLPEEEIKRLEEVCMEDAIARDSDPPDPPEDD